MSFQLLEEIEPIKTHTKFKEIYQNMRLEFSPKVAGINQRIATDLGFLYIYRQLKSEQDKDELVKFWFKASSQETLQLPMGEFHYKPYIDFVYLDKIMNGLYIETVLEQLSKFKNLDFHESCAILSDLERYFVVPLSEMDVKIIEKIKELLKTNQFYSNDLLSSELNVRANYISRRMGYLRNNAYFRVTGTVNFPKIGLTQYIILLESSINYRELIPRYFSSPYTRTIRRCPNQRYDYIISLTLPGSFSKKLSEYLRKLSELNIIKEYFVDEVTSIANNLNFSYYSYAKRPTVLSVNKPGFYVDWFKERVHCMQNKNEIQNSTFHNFEFQGSNENLSVRDLKVLTLIRRDLDASVRTIAKKLYLSWDETNSHIEKIKTLLFPMILLYYTGLNQTALLFFNQISNKEKDNLESLLNRMPQAFSYSFKNGGAIVTVDLMNGAHRLNDLLCETLPELRRAQFSLASKTNGIFRPLPYKFFNEENQSWIFPENFFLFNEEL
ncbi:MAG: hypothetical protein ACTSXA_07620 [Candidatus Heimdallarchaeota archaeon]